MRVYKITFENNKSYIGITSNSIEERLSEHLRESKLERSSHRLLYKAMKKYSFVVEELDYADNWNDLQKLEIKYIKQYSTFFKDGSGYNMTKGGDGTFGHRFKRPESFGIKLSASRKGKDNPNFGRKMTQEAKEKRKETIRKNKTSFDSRSKEVVVIYPNEEQQTFRNAKEAGRAAGITNVNKYARGEIKSHTHRKTGLQFYYLDNFKEKGGVH